MPDATPDSESAAAATEAIAESYGIDENILRELENLNRQQGGWRRGLVIFAVSLFLFISFGLTKNPLQDIVLLVFVLFIHELGHFAGMRLFKYQDVRMFFIPFFGAAVSGRNTAAEGYKEAAVALLGPLPGLLLALVLGAVNLAVPNDLCRQTALMLALINGFNLLPFYLLDGGRLLHTVLFCRNRYLEAFFTAAAGLMLMLLAYALQAWLLGALGFFVLSGSGRVFRTATIASELRREVGLPPDPALDPIPLPMVAILTKKIRRHFPALAHPKLIAGTIMEIWRKFILRPPGVPATVALLMIYGLSVAGTIMVPLIFALIAGGDAKT